MYILGLVCVLFTFTSGFTLPENDGRIVGGKTVEIKDHPYQISLQFNGKHMCGGSIISEKIVVTAAHCTDGTIAANLKIRAGSSYYAKGGQVIPVSKINQHPQYDPITTDYDVAILELSTKIVYGLAGPVKLPNEGAVLKEGSKATVSGWGYTTASRDKAEQLQALEVPVINSNTCKELYSGYAITERMVCAGYLEGGKDACQGDSGGPLVFDGELVGIVSWGLGCAQANQPGIYSNVAELRSFIAKFSGI